MTQTGLRRDNKKMCTIQQKRKGEQAENGIIFEKSLHGMQKKKRGKKEDKLGIREKNRSKRRGVQRIDKSGRLPSERGRNQPKCSLPRLCP